MTSNQLPTKSAVLRTSQIIVLALCSGILFFGILAVVINGLPVEIFRSGAVVSLVMAVFGLSMLITRFIVPGAMAAQAWRQIVEQEDGSTADMLGSLADDAPRINQAFLTTTIVGSAILEGGALGNLVAYLAEGQLYSLVLAGVLLLGILAGFPTRNTYDNWLARQRQRASDFQSLPRR